MKTSYLHTLTDDELSQCLKFFDDEFRMLNLTEGNHATNVFFSGLFKGAIENHFTHLCINHHSIQANGRYLPLLGKGALTSRIIEDYGGGFLHASICSGASQKEVSCQVVDLIRRHCTSIKRLSLLLTKTNAPHQSWELLKTQIGQQLEKLELEIDTCQSHRLTGDVALNLKVLDAKGSRLQQLTSLIRCCRTTLERVSIAGFDGTKHTKSWGTTNWRPILDELGRCTRLRRVILKGHVPKVEHAQLLQSLGTKLEFANLQLLPDVLRRQVVNSCPNSKCSFKVDQHNLNHVDVLAKHVHELVLENPDKCDRLLIRSVAPKLSYIASFFCLAVSNRDGQLTEFFGTPKKTLENIVLSVQDFSKSPRLLHAIAKATGSLRKLYLGADYFRDVAALKLLLSANLNLREVELVTENPLSRVQLRNDIVQILACLRGHRALRAVTLTFQADVVDVRLCGAEFSTECMPFRSRGTKVTICHVPYS